MTLQVGMSSANVREWSNGSIVAFDLLDDLDFLNSSVRFLQVNAMNMRSHRFGVAALISASSMTGPQL